MIARIAMFTAVAGLLLANGAGATGNHNATSVPPSLEIEVLDPGVNPVGDAEVSLKAAGPGCSQVEILPTLIVHRFYYTGDRSFQGPRLPGGPCVIVFNNPKNGERVYVPAQLPPGAPRVHYTAKCIRYDYGPQSVEVCVGLFGKPYVSYTQQTVAGAIVCKTATKAWDTTKNVGNNVCAGVSEVGAMVKTPLTNFSQFVPGFMPLQSLTNDNGERVRDMQARKAECKNKPEEFIRSNR